MASQAAGSQAAQAASQHYLQFELQWASIVLVWYDYALTFTLEVEEAKQAGLTYLVFEQGVLYFSIISLFTVTAIILNFRAKTGFLQSLLNALTLPLSGLLAARFILHMRAFDSNQTNPTSVEDVGSIVFNNAANDPANSEESALASIHSSIVDEFGGDPVARAATGRLTTGQRGPSTDDLILEVHDEHDEGHADGSVVVGAMVIDEEDFSSLNEDHLYLSPQDMV
ncbi:hypothetical protein EIP91_007998 [Steccherinum ochraceum]|uniref:Uncharacterized protein n=1 Tax=Steccherinum ochraceum TaxID=92696 RepID=A0A4R0R3F1_9APHY|nr:hypothetical protein EIP91_007998 [Steccherinum ochraceum]